MYTYKYIYIYTHTRLTFKLHCFEPNHLTGLLNANSSASMALLN